MRAVAGALALLLGPTVAQAACEAQKAAGGHDEMVWIEPQTFTMGADDQRPEERVAHEVTVDGFWIGRFEVTNEAFARFVEATGYRTIAERGLDPALHPDMPPALLEPGSLVFSEPDDVRNLEDVTQWWRYQPGADWRHPEGPASTIGERMDHPVVQIALQDALAYARWAGGRLPTEAEWEAAARGGLANATYSWGDHYDPLLGWKANTWQGAFPLRDEAADGHYGTAPVGCYEANGYGLFDMAGNVWEWTTDWYLPGHRPEPARDPQGPGLFTVAAYEPLPRRVIKGGSWLCANNFCARYRPSARQPMEADLGSSHIGFRIVMETPPPAGEKTR